MTIESVSILTEIRETIRKESPIPVIISGCLGPRGDGYKVGSVSMTSLEAEEYHSKQIKIFAAKTEVDLITAFTINYPGPYRRIKLVF